MLHIRRSLSKWLSRYGRASISSSERSYLAINYEVDWTVPIQALLLDLMATALVESRFVLDRHLAYQNVLI